MPHLVLHFSSAASVARDSPRHTNCCPCQHKQSRPLEIRKPQVKPCCDPAPVPCLPHHRYCTSTSRIVCCVWTHILYEPISLRNHTQIHLLGGRAVSRCLASLSSLPALDGRVNKARAQPRSRPRQHANQQTYLPTYFPFASLFNAQDGRRQYAPSTWEEYWFHEYAAQ